MEGYYSPHDIGYRELYGPGHWDLIHRHSAKADSQEKKLYIMNMLDMESMSFGCKECRNDFYELWNRYKKKIDIYWNKCVKLEDRIIPCGMLLLTVDIHNEVNRKLGKPTITYREAISKYLIEKDGECDDICSG